MRRGTLSVGFALGRMQHIQDPRTFVRGFFVWGAHVACRYCFARFGRRLVRFAALARPMRFNATEARIRGRKGQAIRKRVLDANPLCQICGERASTEVDHITALVNGGDDDPHDDSNRQALCRPCHERKTARDLGHKHRPRIGLDGYPLDEEQ